MLDCQTVGSSKPCPFFGSALPWPLQDSAGLEVEPTGLPLVVSGWREAARLRKKCVTLPHPY